VNTIALRKRFFPTVTAFFLAFWLAAMLLGRDRLFGDPGSLWHIVVGERILATREFLTRDPFSFSHAGDPWIAHCWLCECGLALLHRLDGLNTILAATATLLAVLYTWVAYRLLRAGLHPLLAVLLTLLAVLASAYNFHPRPHLLSIALLGCTFALLCDFESGRIPLRRLFWLAPVFVLWTNIHGGMLGGLGTLAVTVFCWLAARWAGLSGLKLSPGQMLGLTSLVVGCALTAFLNPYGSTLPRTWFRLLASPLLPRLIDEHAPLLQAGWAGGAVLLFGLIYLVALLGVLPSRPRVTWLVPVIWLALSFTRIRHGPLFAITAVLALADMFPHVRWVAWLARKGSVMCRLRPQTASEYGKRFAVAPVVLPCLAIFAVLAVQTCHLWFPDSRQQWVRLDPRSCPIELLPELRRAECREPAGTPIFNEMVYGGFLIYYTPGFRVFIDDRCELYGDDDLMAYAVALRSDPGQIDRWADRYGFNLALTRAGSSFDTHLRDEKSWTLVAQTETATLFRRVEIAREKPGL
jgi:hypothetical protein